MLMVSSARAEGRGGGGERRGGGDLDGGAEGRERVGRGDVLGEDQAERGVQRHVARRGVAGRGRQNRRERLPHRQHASVLFALLLLGPQRRRSKGSIGLHLFLLRSFFDFLSPN
jgi:hypothetical protein